MEKTEWYEKVRINVEAGSYDFFKIISVFSALNILNKDFLKEKYKKEMTFTKKSALHFEILW